MHVMCLYSAQFTTITIYVCLLKVLVICFDQYVNTTSIYEKLACNFIKAR